MQKLYKEDVPLEHSAIKSLIDQGYNFKMQQTKLKLVSYADFVLSVEVKSM
jgi:hypothetical protein